VNRLSFVRFVVEGVTYRFGGKGALVYNQCLRDGEDRTITVICLEGGHKACFTFKQIQQAFLAKEAVEVLV